MGFGEIFGKSWKEYKSNFGAIFKVMLIFYAIPTLILFIFTNWWFVKTGLANEMANIASGNNASAALEILRNSFSPAFFSVFVPMLVVFTLINYFAYVSISSSSLKKEKFSFRDLISNGKEVYWKSVGFAIVLVIFLGLLFLALIIPGIIFLVFWILSYFVFIDEKKGIIKSLKVSFNMIRRRWWRTFGYLLLFMLISIGISIIFGIPSGIIQFVLTHAAPGNSVNLFVFASIVKEIFNLASSFVIIPLGILFIKNFYLNVKRHKN